MKVFISWSGALSCRVAEEMRDWIPSVLHTVQPFVSSSDIYAGARWQQEIAQQLEESQFGIICVTKENIRAPWLNFEAGALAKAIDTSRVVPMAIDLKPAEIPNPLAQFQGQALDRAGVSKLMASLNETCENGLVEGRFQKAFDKWWDDLDQALTRVREEVGKTKSTDADAILTSDRDLLEQILETVRDLSRQKTTAVAGTINVPLSGADGPIRRVMALAAVKRTVPHLILMPNAHDPSKIAVRSREGLILTDEEKLDITASLGDIGMRPTFLDPRNQTLGTDGLA